MGTKIIKNEYTEYRRKRNFLLFLLLTPALLVFGSLVTLYKLEVFKLDLLITIYFPLVIGVFVLLIIIQPKLTLYSMYCDYALLLEGPREPIKTSQKLYTHNWFDNFKNNGFEVGQDFQSYVVLYQYFKKLPGLTTSDPTMVFIIVAKNDKCDFYGDEIDQSIQSIYMKKEEYQKVNKQVAIQFKKYDHLDEHVKEEIETAIIYKSGKQKIVHLTVGYLDSIQSVYYLQPEKRYPNKYVYYLCQEIQNLSFIKE